MGWAPITQNGTRDMWVPNTIISQIGLIKALLVQVFGIPALIRYEFCTSCVHTDPYKVVGDSFLCLILSPCLCSFVNE